MAGALNLERSYNFVDKRRVIDELRTLIEDHRMTLAEVAHESGVNAQTINKWFLGKTQRPQTVTVNAVAGIFGKRIGLVDLEDEDRAPAFEPRRLTKPEQPRVTTAEWLRQ